MITLPGGLGTVSVAQLKTGETVTAAGMLYDHWIIQNLPADAEVEFLMNPRRVQVSVSSGAFPINQAYGWMYRATDVGAGPIRQLDIDFTEPGSNVSIFNSIYKVFAHGAGAPGMGLLEFKHGGSTTGPQRVSASWAAGVPSVDTSHAFVAEEDVTAVTSTWG